MFRPRLCRRPHDTLLLTPLGHGTDGFFIASSFAPVDCATFRTIAADG